MFIFRSEAHGSDCFLSHFPSYFTPVFKLSVVGVVEAGVGGFKIPGADGVLEREDGSVHRFFLREVLFRGNRNRVRNQFMNHYTCVT